MCFTITRNGRPNAGDKTGHRAACHSHAADSCSQLSKFRAYGEICPVQCAETTTIHAAICTWPWQNAYAERLIGTIRRECLDHMIVFGEAHLRRILGKYAAYYNDSRIHRSLNKDAPFHRAIERVGAITSRPVLGGLRTCYCASGSAHHVTNTSKPVACYVRCQKNGHEPTSPLRPNWQHDATEPRALRSTASK